IVTAPNGGNWLSGFQHWLSRWQHAILLLADRKPARIGLLAPPTWMVGLKRTKDGFYGPVLVRHEQIQMLLIIRIPPHRSDFLRCSRFCQSRVRPYRRPIVPSVTFEEIGQHLAVLSRDEQVEM